MDKYPYPGYPNQAPMPPGAQSSNLQMAYPSAPPPPPYSEAPPPYYPQGSFPPQHGMPAGYAMPGVPPHQPMIHPNYYMPSHQVPMPANYRPAAPMPVQPSNPATVVVKGAFDSGARFDSGSQPHIPPPPPGVAPNAAQMAAMQGHNVVGTQKSESFWFGGSGGGYTWW